LNAISPLIPAYQIGNGRFPGKVKIPLREDGTIFPDFPDGSGTKLILDNSLPYSLTCRFYDVASLPNEPDPRFKNKIVIIGSAYSGTDDTHYIPFLLRIEPQPSQLRRRIARNRCQSASQNKILKDPNDIVVWLYCCAVSVIGVVLFLKLRWLAALLSLLCFAILWIVATFAVFCFSSYLLPVGLPMIALILSGGGLGAYLAFTEERERRMVMKLWGRYQDPRLVEYLLHYPNVRGGEGMELDVTVLFADLANFTKTVENLSPTDTLHSLNIYSCAFWNVSY